MHDKFEIWYWTNYLPYVEYFSHKLVLLLVHQGKLSANVSHFVQLFPLRRLLYYRLTIVTTHTVPIRGYLCWGNFRRHWHSKAWKNNRNNKEKEKNLLNLAPGSNAFKKQMKHPTSSSDNNSIKAVRIYRLRATITLLR